MITIDEVESLLTSQREYDEFGEDYYEEFSWSFWHWEAPEEDFTIINDEYMARPVYRKGGGEGGGESVRLVIEVSPHVNGIQKFSMESRFFEKLGYYGSYYGTDWDGSFHEVFPHQKMVTVYEKS